MANKALTVPRYKNYKRARSLRIIGLALPSRFHDAFTAEEMQTIINSDSFYFFPQYSKDFLWAAYANEADKILAKVRK